MSVLFLFFNDTATSEIYTLSLHDALPISGARSARAPRAAVDRLRPARAHLGGPCRGRGARAWPAREHARSEEHTSELQSLTNLVCRLLLEKKKNTTQPRHCTDMSAYHE